MCIYHNFSYKLMVRLAILIALFLSFLAPFHDDVYAEDRNLIKARQLFNKGEDLYAENRVDPALRYYFAAIDLYPSMPKAYYWTGIIYGPIKKGIQKGYRVFP